MTYPYLFKSLVQLDSITAYDQPPPPGKNPFVYCAGCNPILISAPHAAIHYRSGRKKREEGFTSAFAQLLGEKTGAHVMYTHYCSGDDPNWDAHNPYKQRLAEIIYKKRIRFVLDLHGMSNRHKIGMAIGTINGRSCPQYEYLIADTLQANDFHQTTEAEASTFRQLAWDRFVLNHSRFTGGLVNHTVTRFASERCGVGAAQIELCSSVRVVQQNGRSSNSPTFSGNLDGIKRTFHALTHLIQTIVQTE
jgi:hypothetical protein